MRSLCSKKAIMPRLIKQAPIPKNTIGDIVTPVVENLYIAPPKETSEPIKQTNDNLLILIFIYSNKMLYIGFSFLDNFLFFLRKSISLVN